MPSEIWAWLKAENHYKPKKEESRPVQNRASRRASSMTKTARRGKRQRIMAKALKQPLPWRKSEPEPVLTQTPEAPPVGD